MNHTRKVLARAASLAVIGLAALTSAASHAAPGLTGAGVADGFALSEYMNFPQQGVYDYANAPLGDGTLVGVDQEDNELLKLADTNGQSPSTAIASVPFNGGISATATQGTAYAMGIGATTIYSVSASLNLTPIATQAPIQTNFVLTSNQATGDLVCQCTVNGVSEIAIINPVTGAITSLASDVGAGAAVTVSPDGSTVYVEGNFDGSGTATLRGYNVTNLSNIQPVSSVAAPSGDWISMTEVGGGQFSGNFIFNTFGGALELFNPSTLSVAAIATGFTLDSFQTLDPSTGTMFLATQEGTYRLGLADGGLGSEPVGAPEPASLALMGVGVFGLGLVRRVRTRKGTGRRAARSRAIYGGPLLARSFAPF